MTRAELKTLWDDILASCKGKHPTHFQMQDSKTEWLIPLSDSDLILARCRICQSLLIGCLGPDDAFPDPGRTLGHSHIPSPCGYCKPVMLPAGGMKLQSLRYAHAAGQHLGTGVRT